MERAQEMTSFFQLVLQWDSPPISHGDELKAGWENQLNVWRWSPTCLLGGPGPRPTRALPPRPQSKGLGLWKASWPTSFLLWPTHFWFQLGNTFLILQGSLTICERCLLQVCYVLQKAFPDHWNPGWAGLDFSVGSHQAPLSSPIAHPTRADGVPSVWDAEHREERKRKNLLHVTLIHSTGAEGQFNKLKKKSISKLSPIDRWMDKQNVVCVCNKILFSLKKEWNPDTCHNNTDRWTWKIMLDKRSHSPKDRDWVIPRIWGTQTNQTPRDRKWNDTCQGRGQGERGRGGGV